MKFLVNLYYLLHTTYVYLKGQIVMDSISNIKQYFQFSKTSKHIYQMRFFVLFANHNIILRVIYSIYWSLVCLTFIILRSVAIRPHKTNNLMNFKLFQLEALHFWQKWIKISWLSKEY